MAEIEQSWAAFDALRISQSIEQPSDDIYHCRACGGHKRYDVFDDLPVCIECGIQDYSYVSDEPEWRSGGDDGQTADPSRVGAPVNLDHFSAAWGASTVMKAPKWSSRDQRRLVTINLHSSMNHRDRALFHAYDGFDRIGKQILNLQENVMYSAKCKYKAFNEAVLTRGAVRNGIKANCIFQACQEFGVARTTQEIADAFGIPARDLSRTVEIFQEQVPDSAVHVTTPADLIPRFFNAVTDIPDAEKGRIKMNCVKMCKKLDDCVELMGRTPKAVCCAVMYIVFTELKKGPIKSELCKICDVSAPTLGKIEAIIRTQLKDNT